MLGGDLGQLDNHVALKCDPNVKSACDHLMYSLTLPECEREKSPQDRHHEYTCNNVAPHTASYVRNEKNH